MTRVTRPTRYRDQAAFGMRRPGKARLDAWYVRVRVRVVPSESEVKERLRCSTFKRLQTAYQTGQDGAFVLNAPPGAGQNVPTDDTSSHVRIMSSIAHTCTIECRSFGCGIDPLVLAHRLSAYTPPCLHRAVLWPSRKSVLLAPTAAPGLNLRAVIHSFG